MDDMVTKIYVLVSHQDTIFMSAPSCSLLAWAINSLQNYIYSTLSSLQKFSVVVTLCLTERIETSFDSIYKEFSEKSFGHLEDVISYYNAVVKVVDRTFL